MHVQYGFLLMKIKRIQKSSNQNNRVKLGHDFDLGSEESCPRMTKFWSFTKNVLVRHNFYFCKSGKIPFFGKTQF